MYRYNLLIFLGILIIVFPFFNFPSWFENTLFIITGVLVLLTTLVLKKFSSRRKDKEPVLPDNSNNSDAQV